MKISELKGILDKNKINSNSYSLDGGVPHDKHVLSREDNGMWEVYYSERGGKFEVERFNSEEEACNFFLERILSDKTAPL